MKPPPLYEFAVEFALPGIHTLPVATAHSIAEAFRRSLDGKADGVRVLEAVYARDVLRCVCVAPDVDAVHAAIRLAHLAPDWVHDLGPAELAPEVAPAQTDRAA